MYNACQSIINVKKNGELQTLTQDLGRGRPE